MSDGAPAWAHERAEVHPYDPQWAARASKERERLTDLLGSWLVADIEHVGSTAIPGLAAKPIIDLAANVEDPDAATAQAVDVLAADGWHYVPPDLDGRTWRRFFVKPDTSGQHREAHLHLIETGHPRWNEQIAFRDALRRDHTLARHYEDLKYRLSEQHGNDREAYTNGKAAFVADVLRRSARPGSAD